MKFNQLKQNLAKEFYTTLIITGEDSYLRRRAVDFITSAVNVSFPELNVNEIDGQNTTLDEILNACETLPFASEKKIVIVRDFLTQSKQQTNFSILHEKLEKYIDRPNTFCCLVFVCSSPSDFYKFKNATMVDCSKLERNSLIKWVIARVTENNCVISNQTASLIVDYCLSDMSRISTEVVKLTNNSNGGTISNELVESLVYKEVEYVIFDLTTCIGVKNSQKAIAVVDNLLTAGNEPILLFTLLYNFYRRMYYVTISKLDNKQLADILKVKEFAIAKAKENAGRFTQMQLKQALELCAKADE